MFKIKTFTRTILGATEKAVKAFKWLNMRKCRRSCRRFFWSTSALSLWTLKDLPLFTLTTIGEKAKVAFYDLQTNFKFSFFLFFHRTTTGQLSSSCAFSVAAVGGPVWLSFPMDFKEFVKKCKNMLITAHRDSKSDQMKSINKFIYHFQNRAKILTRSIVRTRAKLILNWELSKRKLVENDFNQNNWLPPVCADDVGVHAEHLQPARHLRLLLHAGLEPLAQCHLAIFLW